MAPGGALPAAGRNKGWCSGGQSLLYPRDLLIACEIIPSFLLQIIHFLVCLNVPWSRSPVPLVISTATCGGLLLYLEPHAKKKYTYSWCLFLLEILLSVVTY